MAGRPDGRRSRARVEQPLGPEAAAVALRAPSLVGPPRRAHPGGRGALRLVRWSAGPHRLAKRAPSVARLELLNNSGRRRAEVLLLMCGPERRIRIARKPVEELLEVLDHLDPHLSRPNGCSRCCSDRWDFRGRSKASR